MFDRTERGLLARWWWTVDRPLLGVLGLLALSGLIMVFRVQSACGRQARPAVLAFCHAPSDLSGRRLRFSSSAVRCFRRAAFFRAATGLLGLSLVMLVLTLLIVGAESHGATRWISFGAFAIQPGEFAKPALIVVGAALLARAPGLDNAWPVLGLAMVTMLLLLAQPDVGMALMVGAVVAVQLFVAGLPWLLVILALVLSLGILWQAYHWFPHVAGRIDRFLDPASGDHYQVGLALKAVKSAAWFGSGPGEGRLKNQIPDAHSDFVFAVAAEEFGLIACLLLIGLFSFIVLRGLRRTELVSDRFALIAGAGLLAHFGLQAMVNLGVNLSVLPATGMTLPFISYGGSALCAMAIGMGMFLALTRRRLGQGAASTWSIAMNRPVIITAGGTGGHMFPALALASELERRGRTVALACDERGARFLPEDMAWFKVRASSPSGSVGKRSSGIFRLGLGLLQSWWWLKRQKAFGRRRIRELCLRAGRRGCGPFEAAAPGA